MDDVNSLATDERTARVALAAASEPGDTTTGRLLTAVGAVETVRLATRSGSIPGLDRASTEASRRRLSERLGSGPVQRVLERTQAWMSTFGRLRRCPDRHESIVKFSVYLAAAIVTTQCLITAARTRYRWPTRPTMRRLK